MFTELQVAHILTRLTYSSAVEQLPIKQSDVGANPTMNIKRKDATTAQ